jgi:NADP-dependent 3-hydroxy acid dehydrogenase YdfG
VEELAQSSRTISLVDEIFEINFFANVNIIKAILPVMRERKNGHIIVITGISKPHIYLIKSHAKVWQLAT